jgi:hypothetical protein
VARGRRAHLGVDEHVNRDKTLRVAPRTRRAAPKHHAQHASTHVRKAVLTRHEWAAHMPGPSRARARAESRTRQGRVAHASRVGSGAAPGPNALRKQRGCAGADRAKPRTRRAGDAPDRTSSRAAPPRTRAGEPGLGGASAPRQGSAPVRGRAPRRGRTRQGGRAPWPGRAGAIAPRRRAPWPGEGGGRAGAGWDAGVAGRAGPSVAARR